MREALPNEIGGILIGWRHNDAVVVSRALVVPDPTADGRHYTLDHDAAEEALQLHYRDHPDALEGYVGEWHSHPEAQPPSSLDRVSISKASRKVHMPIALLVLAYEPPTDAITPFGLLVRRRRLGRSVEIAIAHVSSTQEPL